MAVLRGSETAEQKMDPLGLTIRYLPRRRFPDTLKTIPETPEVVAMAEEYAESGPEGGRAKSGRLDQCREELFRRMQDHGRGRLPRHFHGLPGAGRQPRDSHPTVSLLEVRLLDHGQSGTCEADVNAVMSQEVCLKLLEKPGFIQDPVPETERGTLIGVHCVCATKAQWLGSAG